MNELQKGDTIKCRNAIDAVNTMYALQAENIETDFLYVKDGKKGLWLVITKVPKDKR